MANNTERERITMNKKTIVAETILETLAENVPGRGLPAGHMFAALCGLVALDVFQSIIRELEAAGYVENKFHYVTATAKAREWAAARAPIVKS